MIWSMTEWNSLYNNDDSWWIYDDDDDAPHHFEQEMMMTMKLEVIEKKWRRHDDLAVSVNDAAP